jgi:DNA-binding protein HU-beta
VDADCQGYGRVNQLNRAPDFAPNPRVLWRQGGGSFVIRLTLRSFLVKDAKKSFAPTDKPRILGYAKPSLRETRTMSKKFLTDVIATSGDMSAVAAGKLAADIIDAIKAEIVSSGRFTIPDFGAFAVRETPKRTGLNPKTGEKVQIKAGATVRFKASPALKGAALAGVKKGKRKAKA